MTIFKGHGNTEPPVRGAGSKYRYKYITSVGPTITIFTLYMMPISQGYYCYNRVHNFF